MRIETIETRRLRLTPLRPNDAAAMVDVLGTPDLYTFTGGAPPDLATLERRYTAQTGGSGSSDELWLNWIVRAEKTMPIGFIQATVTPYHAEVAWVIGTRWQGNGYATEGAGAVARWLVSGGTSRLIACIHPDHIASQRVATAIGLDPTGEVDSDGEMIWRRTIDPG